MMASMRKQKFNVLERADLIEKIARKIARVQSYEFTGKSMCSSKNPRAQMFVSMAIAAIEEFEA
ncbi:MAG: hypothetical protein NVS2B14_08920 [Chamaesiphon sp.]